MATPKINKKQFEYLFNTLPQKKKWKENPVNFALQAIDWSHPMLASQKIKMSQHYQDIAQSEYGLDGWALDELEQMGEHVRSHMIEREAEGLDVMPYQSAVVSGHGIGKSSLTGIETLYFLVNYPYMQGTITASSFQQLRDKTVPTIAKWISMSEYKDYVLVSNSVNNMRVFVSGHGDAWKFTVISPAKPESFQGQHAAGSASVFMFDEASATPKMFFEIAMGGMTDGYPFLLARGNPTQATGYFKDIFDRAAKGAKTWYTRTVSSLDAQMPNQLLLRNIIETFGADSDEARRRVYGLFPRTSTSQFISGATILEATDRPILEQNAKLPVIIAVDPALGGDDEFVIGYRQGSKTDIFFREKYTDDFDHIIDVILEKENEFILNGLHRDDIYVVLDAAIGASFKIAAKRPDWKVVHFNEKPSSQQFASSAYNKRADLFMLLRQWLSDGGSIPSVDSFCKNNPSYTTKYSVGEELEMLEFSVTETSKVRIEPKKIYKMRTQADPGASDCLALTFAVQTTATRAKRTRKPIIPVKAHSSAFMKRFS